MHYTYVSTMARPFTSGLALNSGWFAKDNMLAFLFVQLPIGVLHTQAPEPLRDLGLSTSKEP